MAEVVSSYATALVTNVVLVDVVCGWYRETTVKKLAIKTHLASLGALTVLCIECEGTGVWDYMVPDVPAGPCTVCKGQGYIYIGG